ncbi:MAG TPA: ABC transporter permease, partial [Dehalococcoidia bacterium]|nr:ABC transporter permease [Dehalococcoidia bacterium]
MIGFLLRRLLQAILTLLLVLLATFVVLRLTGDPAIVLSPPDATPQQVEAIRKSLGLDQPMIVQYVRYVGDMATGNFGTSFRTRKPVRDEIAERGLNTLKLGAISVALG